MSNEAIRELARRICEPEADRGSTTLLADRADGGPTPNIVTEELVAWVVRDGVEITLKGAGVAIKLSPTKRVSDSESEGEAAALPELPEVLITADSPQALLNLSRTHDEWLAGNLRADEAAGAVESVEGWVEFPSIMPPEPFLVLADYLADVIDVSFLQSSPLADLKRRAEAWLTAHLHDEVVAKVRSGEPVTDEDEVALQRLLVSGHVGGNSDLAEVADRVGSLALFARSLVGLDRAACDARFAEFLDDKTHTPHQIRFVQLLIDELVREGMIEASCLYGLPFTSIVPEGPEQLFAAEEADRLFGIVEALN